MKTAKIDKLMNILILISSLLFIIGAYLKITHSPIGDSFFIWSIFIYIVLSSIEIQRLKRIIKEMKFQ
jgi:hypothetical protein